MTRRPARFTQADVTRAVKGAASAGLRVGRIEITPEGKIVLEADDAQHDPGGNSCDAIMRGARPCA